MNVLITIRVTHPTTILGRSTEFKRDARLRECIEGAADAGGRRGASPDEDSRSIACRMAFASSLRPTDSSQRGDSGSALRKYQTTSAPSPPRINIARQPN